MLSTFFLSFFPFYTKCARDGYSLLECDDGDCEAWKFFFFFFFFGEVVFFLSDEYVKERELESENKESTFPPLPPPLFPPPSSQILSIISKGKKDNFPRQSSSKVGLLMRIGIGREA